MTDAIVLTDEKTKLFTALSVYAAALSHITDEQAPAFFEMTDQLETLAEEVRKRLRDRLLLQVQKDGVQLTEKGTMGTTIGGYKVSAIPTRTGVDPKKLEALLRRLVVEPTKVMDTTIAYKVNDAKLLAAIGAGTLTVEDVNNCKYDKAFRVQVERE